MNFAPVELTGSLWESIGTTYAAGASSTAGREKSFKTGTPRRTRCRHRELSSTLDRVRVIVVEVELEPETDSAQGVQPTEPEPALEWLEQAVEKRCLDKRVRWCGVDSEGDSDG